MFNRCFVFIPVTLFLDRIWLHTVKDRSVCVFDNQNPLKIHLVKVDSACASQCLLMEKDALHGKEEMLFVKSFKYSQMFQPKTFKSGQVKTFS